MKSALIRECDYRLGIVNPYWRAKAGQPGLEQCCFGFAFCAAALDS